MAMMTFQSLVRHICDGGPISEFVYVPYHVCAMTQSDQDVILRTRLHCEAAHDCFNNYIS